MSIKNGYKKILYYHAFSKSITNRLILDVIMDSSLSDPL